jgi:hypothetical protein
MKFMLGAAMLALALAGACAGPGGGGQGQGDDDGASPNQNDNANSNGGVTNPPDQNDNQGTGNDNEAGDPPANDNGDDSGDLPTAFRLDGVWDDNGRHVIIEQNGDEVAANYFSEYICDLDSGPVPVDEEPTPGSETESTFLDFRGVLSSGVDVLPGDLITGETSICLFGFDGMRGLALGEMTLSVVDENTISGEWEYDGDGDASSVLSGSILLTREQ